MLGMFEMNSFKVSSLASGKISFMPLTKPRLLVLSSLGFLASSAFFFLRAASSWAFFQRASSSSAAFFWSAIALAFSSSSCFFLFS
jgi:succinylarginine dihydrolase